MFLKKAVRFYNQLEENLLICSLIFTVLLIFMQVVMRKVFNNSITWSEELAKYIFIWQIWLGTSIGFRDGKHIQITIIQDLLKGKARIAYSLLSRAILLAFCVFLILMGWSMVQRLIDTNYLSAALRLPLAFVYLALPFSSLAVSCRILGEMVGDLKRLFAKPGAETNRVKGGV